MTPGNSLIVVVGIDETRAKDDVASSFVEDLKARSSVRGPWLVVVLLLDLGG